MIHTVGISFNLIIVRINQGISIGDAHRIDANASNGRTSTSDTVPSLQFRTRQTTQFSSVAEIDTDGCEDAGERQPGAETRVPVSKKESTGMTTGIDNRLQWAVE